MLVVLRRGVTQLPLPFPCYPSPCGHSIHIDRRAGDEVCGREFAAESVTK